MDIELFKRKLEELIVECGGLGGDDLQIECSARPYEQRFTPADPRREFDGYLAHRRVQPVRVAFTIYTDMASRRHHDSGDDRKLHPDLNT